MTAGDGRGDVELLRAEIQRTRAELGETVQALAARADVKARMRESADRARDRVREQATHTADVVRGSVWEAGQRVRRIAVPGAVVAMGAVAVTVLVVMMRGRRR